MYKGVLMCTCIGTHVMAHIYRHIHTIHMYTHNVHTQTQHAHTHTNKKQTTHRYTHGVDTQTVHRHRHRHRQTQTDMLTIKVQRNPLITNYCEVQSQETCMMRFWKPHYQNLNRQDCDIRGSHCNILSKLHHAVCLRKKKSLPAIRWSTYNFFYFLQKLPRIFSLFFFFFLGLEMIEPKLYCYSKRPKLHLKDSFC